MKQFFAIIDGPMGGGKTTVAKLLRNKLSRTAIIGKDRIKWFVSDFDRAPKDVAMTDRVVRAMCKEYIKNGLNIILDEGFMEKRCVLPYIELAKDNEMRLFMYQIEAPRKILLARLSRRPKAEAAKTKVSQAKSLRNITRYFKNKNGGAIIFNSTVLTPRQIANRIAREMTSVRR